MNKCYSQSVSSPKRMQTERPLTTRNAAAVSFLAGITLNVAVHPSGRLADGGVDVPVATVRTPLHRSQGSLERAVSIKEDAATTFLSNIPLGLDDGRSTGEDNISPKQLHASPADDQTGISRVSPEIVQRSMGFRDAKLKSIKHEASNYSMTPDKRLQRHSTISPRVSYSDSLYLTCTAGCEHSSATADMGVSPVMLKIQTLLPPPVSTRPSLRHVNIIHYGQLSSTRQGLLGLFANSRIVVATAGGTPITIMSCIRHNDEKLKQRRQKMKASQSYLERISSFSDKKRRIAESYAHLLTPSGSLEEGVVFSYDASYLDDPELKTGKHRTVIALPCLMGSILQYTKPADLRKELNDQFRDAHPDIHATLSLSKIRKLKKRMLEVSLQEDLEISSVAKGYVFLEKLIMKGLVNKSNRRMMAAICLLLACKVNQPKGYKFGPVLEAMESHMEVASRDVREHEFMVFASLEFMLYIPLHEFLPHFERIFASLDYNNVQEYLGDNPFFLAK